MPPDLSLNEVEGLAQKAARGAGLAWGLADDAGRSARWLAAHGVDWASSLLALLDTSPPPSSCPLLHGCLLADSAAAHAQFTFAHIVAPVWLLPPLFLAAAQHGQAFALHIGGIDVGGMPPLAAAPLPALAALESAQVEARIGGAAPLLPFAFPLAQGRPRIAAALAARLNDYAARTYVPASAQSRARGAGSATRDDD